MRRWVVTGPTGAGKSELTRALAERGAAVLYGDELGHEVLRDEDVIAAIANEFGDGYVVDGTVDRPALGRLVFADPDALERLNALTHPPLQRLMNRRLDELADAGGHDLAVLEAAVYFLLPQPPRADLVITVVAGEENRLERLVAGGLDESTARDRIRRQSRLPMNFAAADITVPNDGTREDLAGWAERLLREHR